MYSWNNMNLFINLNLKFWYYDWRLYLEFCSSSFHRQYSLVQQCFIFLCRKKAAIAESTASLCGTHILVVFDFAVDQIIELFEIELNCLNGKPVFSAKLFSIWISFYYEKNIHKNIYKKFLWTSEYFWRPLSDLWIFCSIHHLWILKTTFGTSHSSPLKLIYIFALFNEEGRRAYNAHIVLL